MAHTYATSLNRWLLASVDGFPCSSLNQGQFVSAVYLYNNLLHRFNLALEDRVSAGSEDIVIDRAGDTFICLLLMQYLILHLDRKPHSL